MGPASPELAVVSFQLAVAASPELSCERGASGELSCERRGASGELISLLAARISFLLFVLQAFFQIFGHGWRLASVGLSKKVGYRASEIRQD